MEILTAAEMAAVDRRTVELGVPVAELMENAGGAVARFCLRRYPAARRVVVLCGKGNNGGDGMVAARVLAGAGVGVEVWLLGRADEVKGDAAGALARLRADVPGVKVREILGDGNGGRSRSLQDDNSKGQATTGRRLESDDLGLSGVDLILDAVVGTGFKPPLRGVAVVVRDLVAKTTAPVVAVDLPSGWDADSMAQTVEGAYRADAVVTFTRPKLAHVFGHMTERTFGPVAVAEIGSPDEAVEPTHRDEAAMNGAPRLTWAGAGKAIAERPRDVNANKGKYGHVLVVGGSYGTAGAPSMASLAALRTGSGLVTAAVPGSVMDTVARVAPELMMRELDQGSGIRDEGSEDNGVGLELLEEEALARLLKGISVVAIGPGLGQAGTTPEFVRGFVERVSLPMVIDADGLNAIAGRTEVLTRASAMKDAKGRPRTIVLTPHPGEMARLVGMTIAEVEKDRLGLARRFATEHGMTLVLKGWRTLVAHPDGRVAVNTTGNPAMAKGGSGDILTGICAAMLAQFPEDVAKAVEAAVFLHGLAGDFAALKMDEHTVLATDTVTCLSDAFRYRVTDEDGLTWICGMR